MILFFIKFFNMSIFSNKKVNKFFFVLIAILIIYSCMDALNNPEDFLKGFFSVLSI